MRVALLSYALSPLGCVPGVVPAMGFRMAVASIHSSAAALALARDTVLNRCIRPAALGRFAAVCGAGHSVALLNAVIVGLGILCLPQLLIFRSAGKLSPALSVACLATVAVFLAITGRLAITPAVVGLAGVLFLLDRGLDISVRQSPWFLLPLTAAGVLAWALGAAEKHMQRLSIVEALFCQCVASAVLLFLASEILEHEAVNWSVTVATGFAVSAVLTTVCGYLLFYWLLGKFGAGRVSTLQWTQPLVATLESVLAGGRSPRLELDHRGNSDRACGPVGTLESGGRRGSNI